MAVEHSLCPSKFQELADPQPLETDVAFVSYMVTRAARLLTICSIFVSFASYEVSLGKRLGAIFESGYILHE